MSECKTHYFHKECLIMQLKDGDSLKCCVCQHIYGGPQKSDMPHGEMKWRLLTTTSCDGFEGNGTWDIFYSIWDGKMKDGKRFKGTRRRAYLPDTNEGREILALLIKAFERKLTFTVGTSVTTGVENVVTWAGIHHKTSLSGGAYGYPDQGYLERVR